MPKASKNDALRAVRWVPQQPGVYETKNIAGSGPIVFSHGTVIGVGEPIGESGRAISEEFALNLIAAGHAEPCDPSEPPAETPTESTP